MSTGSKTMTTLGHLGASKAGAGWLTTAADGLARGWRRLVAEAKAKRDAAHLQAMDDRELADIGLGRSEIAAAVFGGRDPRR